MHDVQDGAETPWRKYVDCEIQGTPNMKHGLIGGNLPTNCQNANGRVTAHDRQHDHIQSRYSVWTNWGAFTGPAAKSIIEQAIDKPAGSIANNEEMMSRNGT